MASDEVKLYASVGSPYVCRVEIVLHLKGIKYKIIEEDLKTKSADLLKYNPVHKEVPVLVHNGKPISESLVILEYIDHVWKRFPILPHDPYEKALARFWTKFIDDTCIPAIFEVFGNVGDGEVMSKACEQLGILENELATTGTKFFGGDNINIIDIAAAFIAYWLGMLEETTEIKIVTEDKFPKINEWADNFTKCEVVKQLLPPRVLPPKPLLLQYFNKRFGKA